MTSPTAPVSQEQKELKVIPLRGCEGLGAASYLLKIDGHFLLLDAGYTEKEQDLHVLQSHSPEAVFVSHAHMDHIRSLPVVHRAFPNIPIYMTPPTKALSSIILHNAMHVASLKKTESYTQEELNETLKQVVTVEFDREFDFKDLKFVFRCAGHVLGAACVLITGSSKVLYTGDFSLSPSLTTPTAHIPGSPEVVDLLITESTHGELRLPPRQREIDDFCHEVKKIIQRGGRVLIPSFALGRAQEVMAILLKEMEEGHLDGVPVILDGLTRIVAINYDEYPDYVPVEFYRLYRRSRWVHPISTATDRKRVLNAETPCVIIASSGMLTGGPSVKYARKILSEEKSAIFVTGYVDEEAPGRRILDSKSSETVELKVKDEKGDLTTVSVPRKCEVHEYKLSAHSDQQGLIRFAASYHPMSVLLVHGKMKAKIALSGALSASFCQTVVIPQNREEIDVRSMVNLGIEIKSAEAQVLQANNSRRTYEELFTDEIHAKYPDINLQVYRDTLASTKMLAFFGSQRRAETTVFRLLSWSLKYAQTDEGLDFEFPAAVFRNGLLFLRSLFGRRFQKKIRVGLRDTIAAMFKNLIIFDGPISTRDYFKTSIDSMDQLSFAVESFKKHFGKLGVRTPKYPVIKDLCKKYVKGKEYSALKEKYTRIFGAR